MNNFGYSYSINPNDENYLQNYLNKITKNHIIIDSKSTEHKTISIKLESKHLFHKQIQFLKSILFFKLHNQYTFKNLIIDYSDKNIELVEEESEPWRKDKRDILETSFFYYILKLLKLPNNMIELDNLIIKSEFNNFELNRVDAYELDQEDDWLNELTNFLLNSNIKFNKLDLSNLKINAVDKFFNKFRDVEPLDNKVKKLSLLIKNNKNLIYDNDYETYLENFNYIIKYYTRIEVLNIVLDSNKEEYINDLYKIFIILGELDMQKLIQIKCVVLTQNTIVLDKFYNFLIEHLGQHERYFKIIKDNDNKMTIEMMRIRENIFLYSILYRTIDKFSLKKALKNSLVN